VLGFTPTLDQVRVATVSQAWREAFVHVEEEEIPQQTPNYGYVGLFPLDITPIAWEYPFKYLCVGSIWWDQHRFGNNALGGYFNSKVPLCGER
jgi:hypothetical protein